MILIVDDEIAVRTSLALLVKQLGLRSKAAVDAESTLQQLNDPDIKLIFLDMNFASETTGADGLRLLRQIKSIKPDIPVILITGWATINLAVEGMKAGAFDFISKPWDNDHVIRSISTALALSEKTKSSPQASKNRKKLDEEFDFRGIIGQDPKIVRILEEISLICKTDASVLIQGESGTGKELVAEAIHKNSLRKNGPFVKVNLGGISTSLFESEMFGHQKGAFTDAKSDRMGRFELARNGTIFLDEIGDLELSNQVKMLRVLQNRTYEVLGSSKAKTADVRVICATNKDLKKCVESGEFREDLFYRINLITIKLPLLRERRHDIPLLASYFLDEFRKLYHKPALQLPDDALNFLMSLPLPGNIRELRNLIERTVLVCNSNVLSAEHLQRHLSSMPVVNTGPNPPGMWNMTLDELEKERILEALAKFKNNLSVVAKSLGISRGALYRRLEKYEIDLNN